MGSAKKKYRVRALPVVLLLTIIIGVCILLAVVVTNQISGPPQPVIGTVSDGEKSTESGQDTSSDVSMAPAPASVRLVGVGDNLIHEGIYNQAKARGGEQGYDFELAYQNLRELIGLADIASINQETVMVRENPLSGYPTFNSPTELGDYLAGFGFDVFNLANNHTLDQTIAAGGSVTGAGALTSYLDFWASHPEVKTTGLYRDAADFEQIRTIEKNGVVFSFIGMTELTNGLSMPADTDVILMRMDEEEQIRARIEKARSISDVVVVNVHWGTEYAIQPTDEQKALAQKMADWGADILLGHHPHVLQPVEYIERADGSRAVVAYSLGNFISAQDAGERMVGGALDVTVTKNFETNETTITNVRFVPVITHFESGYKNIRLYTLDQYNDDLAAAHGVRNGKTPDFSLAYIDQVIANAGIKEEFLTDWH